MPILFLINLIIALIAAFVASSKGRNAIGWFLLCFFTGWIPPFSNIIVLIVLLIMPDAGERRQRHALEAGWRRRHQEGFEQERHANKRFREHVVKRLDRQDEVLGLPSLEDVPLGAPDRPKEIVTYPIMGNGTWYVVINGREAGPHPEQKIIEMLKREEITGQNYAWSEGMQDWQRTFSIGNFSAHC